MVYSCFLLPLFTIKGDRAVQKRRISKIHCEILKSRLLRTDLWKNLGKMWKILKNHVEILGNL